MDRTLAELEELVRNRICGVCSDRKMDGTCGLEEPGQCALFRLFPQVAEAIQTYRKRQSSRITSTPSGGTCVRCAPRRRSDGSCGLRQQVQCALDAYLLLVVEAIEEATGKDFGQAAASTGRMTGLFHVQL